MEFADVVRSRRMCRRYDPEREVAEATLTQLLALAGRAPSAGFSQGRDFVVLRDAGSRDDFWAISAAAAPRPPGRWIDGMRTAPVLILCLSDPQRYLDRYALPDKGRTDRDAGTWPVPYWDVDTGMAALLLLLAAEDAGLGACFFGVERDSESALRRRFGIPEGHRFTGVVSVGHRPAGAGKHRHQDPPSSTQPTEPTDPPPSSGHPPRPVSHRPEPRALGEYVHAERFGEGWSGDPS